MYIITDQITATTIEIDPTQDDVQEIETTLAGLYEDPPQDVLDAITELAELLDGRNVMAPEVDELARYLALDVDHS